MTLRRQLAVSLVALLALIGLNLAIVRWGSTARAECVERLRRTVERKTLVAMLRRDIEDRLRQVRLLSEIEMDGSFQPSQEALGEIRNDLEAVNRRVEQLRSLAGARSLGLVEEFARTYRFLHDSLIAFHDRFGGPGHDEAMGELSRLVEPTARGALNDLLALERQEAQLLEAASQEFYDVSSFTNGWMVSMLVCSALLILAMGYLLYRHLSRELAKLKSGVDAIGRGDLDHRIEVTSDDELGQLGTAFNSMTRNLQSAQQELRHTAEELETRHQDMEKQRQHSLSLLHNILPSEVAEELQRKGNVDPKYFEDVSILFLDFVGFTLATEKLAAEELVQLLHEYFTTFDRIVERYGLEKLKTIGDAYMCAGGLPVRNPSHPVDIVMAAFEMIESVEQTRRSGIGPRNWGARIGIHTGPVIAGVVGIQKFAFDIWGDTVNYSSRMESSGQRNRINLSASTYSRVKDFFHCEKRGKIPIKEGREVEMYFAEQVLPKLLGGSSELPPPGFVRRYRIYFQKDPPAFPEFLADDRWVMNRQAS